MVSGIGLLRCERTELLNELARSPTDFLGTLGSIVLRGKPGSTSLFRFTDKGPKPTHLIDHIYLIEEVIAITRSKLRNLASAFEWVDLFDQDPVGEAYCSFDNPFAGRSLNAGHRIRACEMPRSKLPRLRRTRTSFSMLRLGKRARALFIRLA